MTDRTVGRPASEQVIPAADVLPDALGRRDFVRMGGGLLALSVLGTGCGDVTDQAYGRQASVPAGLLFFSDWRTARGNSLRAVNDGGKWDFVSAGHEASMEIVPGAAHDFPSTNVFRVIATAARTGWSELRVRTLPIPAVGQSRYYRWYIRVTQPDGLADSSTHPIQDIYAVNWSLQVDNGSRQWRCRFDSYGSPFPNDRWPGPLLDKSRTYRIEMHLDRYSATDYFMHVRVFDDLVSTSVPLFVDADFSNNNNSNTLARNPSLRLRDAAGLNGITAGCNGIGGSAPFPFTYAYQGCFAVRADDWCGQYTGAF